MAAADVPSRHLADHHAVMLCRAERSASPRSDVSDLAGETALLLQAAR